MKQSKIFKKFYLYFTLLKLIDILTLNTLLHNIKTTCVVKTEVQQGIWSLNCGIKQDTWQWHYGNKVLGS